MPVYFLLRGTKSFFTNSKAIQNCLTRVKTRPIQFKFCQHFANYVNAFLENFKITLITQLAILEFLHHAESVTKYGFTELNKCQNLGLGEITRTHAHSPRILRVFSAHSPRIFRTRALRGKYAENARRIRVSATRTFRVFSAHSPRILRAPKNLKRTHFFNFSKGSKILKIPRIFKKN